MMSEDEYTEQSGIVEWKGEEMLSRHSFQESVKEIGAFANNQDVVTIDVIGEAACGKSELSRALAHQLHEIMKKKYKTSFNVRVCYDEELENIEEVLAGLEPVNHILILDELSFITGEWRNKNPLAQVRHLGKSPGVKVILIRILNYAWSVPKYMKHADFRYFLTIGSEELERLKRLVGSKNLKVIQEQIRARHDGIVTGRWQSKDGKKDKISYGFRKPFIPVLFINPLTLRMVVSPTRQWLNSACKACNKVDKESEDRAKRLYGGV